MRERLGIAAGGALAFLTSTPGVEFALGAVVLVLGVPVWSGYSHEIGIALVAAGAIAVVHGAVTFVLEERRRRAAAAAEEERGHAEMRRISDLARELLLETTLWTDIDEFRSWVQARQWQAERELRPPREWSVASIVGRGREDLDADAVDDWIALARGLRQQAQQLADMIDQEFPGQPAERRSELRTVYRAVDSASSAAQHLAAARTRLIQTHWTTPEEKRAAEDALRSNLDLFYGACEWIEGTVMRIEPDAELLQAIESSHLRHGKDAAERAAARRELQAISARSGAQMLIDAAPSAGVLVRSTLGRSGTLHDIAADEAFALRSDDEPQGLVEWRRRIASAERTFAEAIGDRGWDMSHTTQWFRVKVNDGVRELTNAIQRLEEDLSRSIAPGFSTEQRTMMLEGSRERVREAVRRLVEEIGRLQAHEAR